MEEYILEKKYHMSTKKSSIKHWYSELQYPAKTIPFNFESSQILPKIFTRVTFLKTIAEEKKPTASSELLHIVQIFSLT